MTFVNIPGKDGKDIYINKECITRIQDNTEDGEEFGCDLYTRDVKVHVLCRARTLVSAIVSKGDVVKTVQ